MTGEVGVDVDFPAVEAASHSGDRDREGAGSAQAVAGVEMDSQSLADLEERDQSLLGWVIRRGEDLRDHVTDHVTDHVADHVAQRLD